MRSAETESDVAFSDEADVFEHQAPLLVQGHFDVWWLWTAIGFTVILTLLAAIVAVVQPQDVKGVAVAAVLGAAVSGGMGWFQFRQRRWLTWDATGFQIRHRERITEHLDSDVAALSIGHDWQHSFGTVVAEVHGVRLWFDDPAVASCHWLVRSPLDEPSPLEPLLNRLKVRLIDRAEASLRRGEAVSGGAWVWHDGNLGTLQGLIPLDDISAFDSTLKELRIWRNAEPRPAVRLRMRGRDVWLLSSLLESRIGRPGDPGVAPAPGLGRILREHRPKSASAMSFVLALLAAVVAGVCCAAALMLRLLPLALLGGGIGVTAIALISAARRLRRAAFRMHESGISQNGLAGDRVLGFAEIDQFAFDARRQYSKGRYLGTMFSMTFLCQSRPQSSIFHTERAAFETEDLARLRDRVSEEIASRLARQWAQETTVVWTPELTLRAESLRYHRRGRMLAWSSQAVDIPFERIGDFDVREGWFLVWSRDEDRPLFKVRSNSPNFYPGLLVFEQLVSLNFTG